jgi:hypothetical protein
LAGRSLSRSLSAGAALAWVLLTPATVTAQWTDDTSLNTRVCTINGSDQIQPKIRATPDAGVYISWFDQRTPGYSVFLQRLDAQGLPQWDAAGLLIASRTLSSTTDYDLTVDSDGNAIIAFNDTRFPPGQQITVQKVTPDGQFPWGPDGVQVTTGDQFRASPKVAVLSDGSIAVGWTQSEMSPTPSGWRLQRLNAQTGAPEWAAGGLLINEAGRSLTISDLKPGSGGSVIALWVRPLTTSALSAKGLVTQRFTASGDPTWSSAQEWATAVGGAGVPPVVYQAISGASGKGIQNGYFPGMVPDGSGGAVFAWYDVGGTRQAWIQHITADGTFRFPDDGLAVNTTPGSSRIRIGAAAVYVPGPTIETGKYLVAWPDANASPQNAWAVMAQRIAGNGALQWGGAGTEIVPNSAQQTSFVHVQHDGQGGAIVACFQARGVGTGVVLVSRILDTGASAWEGQPLLACSVESGKSRLDSAALNSTGHALALAWGDTRNGPTQIFAQRVNADGSFGLPDSGVTPCNPADIAQTDASPGADGQVDNGDFQLFIASFFSADCPDCGQPAAPACNPADIASTDATPGADGCVDNGDFQVFVASFFTAECP